MEDVTIILPESVELMAFGKVSSIIEHLCKQRGLYSATAFIKIFFHLCLLVE